jgi:CubicO group peptidase (beta-lactamase class C family)
MASLELDVPITGHNVFNVGSTSKQFTAASILLLVRDGKLSLDDDVRRYVPRAGNVWILWRPSDLRAFAATVN